MTLVVAHHERLQKNMTLSLPSRRYFGTCIYISDRKEQLAILLKMHAWCLKTDFIFELNVGLCVYIHPQGFR